MQLSMMRKEKELKYVAMRSKAVDQLLKKKKKSKIGAIKYRVPPRNNSVEDPMHQHIFRHPGNSNMTPGLRTPVQVIFLA